MPSLFSSIHLSIHNGYIWTDTPTCRLSAIWPVGIQIFLKIRVLQSPVASEQCLRKVIALETPNVTVTGALRFTSDGMAFGSLRLLQASGASL